jgi:predicted RNase H-like HicB family nuclease
MQYVVEISENDEGFSVSCPGLPGCWSQGKTTEEAMLNIKDAIETYLETIKLLTQGKETQIVEVAFS